MAYISFQPNDYFNTKLYTGNSTTTNAITGVGFQPDWVWLKSRNYGDSHRLYDAVRGSSNYIVSNATVVQNNLYPLTSFDSDGFTIGSSDPSINGAYNYVSWNWKANGSGSANTDGSINTTYTSANTTSGVSIITYTGNKTSGATIGHGLGAVPKMIIGKRLDATASWGVYHSSLGATKYLELNATSASATSTAPWNDTEPTSSVITLGNWDNVNASSGSHVIYAFAEKKGFSKFGSYTGNGSADGTFIYTGFKPAWLMVKKSSASGDNWSILDNKRNTFNVMDKYLDPNSSNAEGTADIWDFTSNGFKMRNTFSGYNASGATFIYMAFAEHPLVSSNDIPATAR